MSLRRVRVFKGFFKDGVLRYNSTFYKKEGR